MHRNELGEPRKTEGLTTTSLFWYLSHTNLACIPLLKSIFCFDVVIRFDKKLSTGRWNKNMIDDNTMVKDGDGDEDEDKDEDEEKKDEDKAAE